MRLKKLLVSGFKSFVDQTDIRLPSHLVGVVGPNGCGKSNVIDAVRWVMGESSAKTLRGDNMADVIFNGSTARKPVGKVSVELIFDNHDGQVPGNYGQFAEISVKRMLTRDGNSTYQINNIKTRRKDVLDLFRGTGLGPRSYSIIEQGMVGRIVEARPEELRVFIEEAAGTSRYKDRRRETENRIAHTRENLDRVADIRDELDRQLRRLKRQAASARRYRVLKSEEQELDGQLSILKLSALNRQLEEQDRLTAKHENTLQGCLSDQRKTEAMVESIRRQQSEAHEKNNQTQQAFYQVGAEISSLEQRIEHRKENSQRQGEEMHRLESIRLDHQKQIDAETSKYTALRQRLDAIRPEFESFQESLADAESELVNADRALQDWLEEMEIFNRQSREPARQVEIQKTRIVWLQQQLERTEQNRVRLNDQVALLSAQISSTDVDSLRCEVEDQDRKYEQAEKQFNRSEQELKQTYTRIEQKREAAANARTLLQEVVSRLQSLQEIQEASLGTGREDLAVWSTENNLGRVPRLADKIEVADGWERAADRILNGYLSALCTDGISLDMFVTRPECDFSIVRVAEMENVVSRIPLPGMSDRIIEGASYMSGLIAGVYVAESLEQGLGYQDQLTGRECIVTRQGELIGANWISFASQGQIETGVLVREDEITRLLDKKQQIARRLEAEEDEITSLDDYRKQKEVELESRRGALNDMRSDLTVAHNRFGREETRYLEAREQIRKLNAQIEETETRITDDEAEIENAGALLETAVKETENFDQKWEKLIYRRNQFSNRVAEKREIVSQSKEKHHDKALTQQQLEADVAAVRGNLERLQNDLKQAEARLVKLEHPESSPGESIAGLEKNLDELLEKKLDIDKKFSVSRELVSNLDDRINRSSHLRTEQIDHVDKAREALDQQKLARQEVLVRRDTMVETINTLGYDVEEYSERLPQDAVVEDWQAKLEDIERKIAGIGPVNLVAIEEFDEQSERMEYLQRQYEDLTEALDTLEQVIRKIDRETRSRFKETFDTINAGFNQFFPKLFGGGSAELFLTSDDLLTTGIGVMARPPGKRNSHIHLLSGGEKALTAVALLFSLFELNPAPFCMLDEVDAPLDDANVDRYCETLKTLASKSQMIVITHNKITMAAMDLLVGVTMEEAGVSRLVSVDMDQAMEMAAQ